MRARAEGPVYVFVGPTLAGLAGSARKRLLRGLRVRPPVKRHDVEKLAERERRDTTLVIVDGVFHDTLAVGHAEIRDALARGLCVWGLSSMGAIRAREMGALGVRGYGRVFARFSAEEDFQDDEVALLHEPEPPWRAASEPLVHLRAAARHLVEAGAVREDVAREVIADLKARWYGERTLPLFIQALSRHVPRAVIARELGDFARFREKTQDLQDFLEERPWRSS